MTLYDDAYTEYQNRINNNTFIYMGSTFYVYDFIYNPTYLALYDSACQDNAASSRCLVLPNIETPIASTSAAIISLLDIAYNLAQQINDGYLAITNQITASTITITSQIIPAWNTFDASYTNPRILSPTNQALASSIAAIPVAATRIQSTVSRTLNSPFQISTTIDAMVNYSVDISCTMNLTSGQSGTVALQICPTSGFSSGVQTISQGTNSNSGSLTIGLNLTQIGTAVLGGYVPKTYWAKLVTTNNIGTPTYTFKTGQETLF